MAKFPLPTLPKQPYNVGGVAFGAIIPSRKGRTHAACDLIIDAGTEVYAVAKGFVHMPAYEFIPTNAHQIQAIEIWHPSIGLLIRYGEITVKEGLNAGKEIAEGEVIGTVARQGGATMLHIEMFKSKERSNLSSNPNGIYDNVPASNYNRRHDLVDPTPYLDQWSAGVSK